MRFQVNLQIDQSVINSALDLVKILVIRGTTVAGVIAAISSQIPQG